MKKAVTLLSGGLDSSVATLIARETCEVVQALTFDYGQRAALREINAAKALCSRYDIAHEVIELPWLALISRSALTDKKAALPIYDANKGKESAAAVWVPNRNAVFAAVAGAHAEAKGLELIIAGFNAEEARTFPDNSSGFIESVNALFSYSTLSRPTIMSPTRDMTKQEIAREAIRLGLSTGLLWSCYDGGERPCGTCESCARSAAAFKAAGIARTI